MRGHWEGTPATGARGGISSSPGEFSVTAPKHSMEGLVQVVVYVEERVWRP